jgi:hypothetical protein
LIYCFHYSITVYWCDSSITALQLKSGSWLAQQFPSIAPSYVCTSSNSWFSWFGGPVEHLPIFFLCRPLGLDDGTLIWLVFNIVLFKPVFLSDQALTYLLILVLSLNNLMSIPIVIIQLALKFSVFDTKPFNTVFQLHLTLFVMITHLAH